VNKSDICEWGGVTFVNKMTFSHKGDICGRNRCKRYAEIGLFSLCPACVIRGLSVR